MGDQTPSAYPLAWPHGWPRTPGHQRQVWPRDGVLTLSGALRELQDELRRLGARNVVLSSNCSLGNEKPPDPGVVAYATYEAQQIAIPCDRWASVPGNLRAIAKTIEAMRGMERWGAKHMIRAMFQGFAALPAPDDWHSLLGVGASATLVEAERAWIAALREAGHGRLDSDDQRCAALNTAIARARKELGNG